MGNPKALNSGTLELWNFESLEPWPPLFLIPYGELVDFSFFL